MAFGNGRFVIFGKFPEIPEREEIEFRIKDTVVDNTVEHLDLIEVSKDKNQMILLIDYEQGDPNSYLEIQEVFSDRAGNPYSNVMEEGTVTGIEVSIIPHRYRASGGYRVAIPLCDDKVGIQSRIVGDVTGTIYGVKAVFGAA